MSTITKGAGTLRYERESIDVMTMGGVEYDPDWEYTDAAGHEHRWVDGEHPTLRWVVDQTYFCVSCNDDHEDGHLECRECGQFVRPGTKSVPPGTTMIAGPTRYYLDDREVTKEEAEAWLKA